MSPTDDPLLQALLMGDGKAILEQGFNTRRIVPSEQLQSDMIPRDPSWDFGHPVQPFALLFDGYAWAEATGVDIHDLPRSIEADWRAGTLARHPVDYLRCALFAVQRMYRDAWDTPEEALIRDLLGAIRIGVESTHPPALD